MTSLTVMKFHANNFSGTLPSDYQAWTDVKVLWLFDNPYMSGTLPAAWGNGMTNLTDFWLGGTIVYPEPTPGETSSQSHRGLLEATQAQPDAEEYVSEEGSATQQALADVVPLPARPEFAWTFGCKTENLMTGTLPPSWGKLSKLNFLRIDCIPKLTGDLPPEWSALEKLEVRHRSSSCPFGVCPYA
jgi:hypothetical protein